MRCATILFLALCGGAVGVPAADPAPLYDVKIWRDLSDRRQSRDARRVVRGGDPAWIHAETRNFIYHASSYARLTSVAEEAEYAYGLVIQRLGWPADERKAHVYIIEDERQWLELIQRSARREDGLAFHKEHEIFILRDRRRPSRYIDIPHEMVHFALWQAHGRRVPLWLDEVLAVGWGWEIAQAYREGKRQELFREQPAVRDEYILAWDRLTALTAYPESAESVEAFYRQSDALTRAILNRIGIDRAGAWVVAMTRPQSRWDLVLATQFDCTEADLAAIVDEAGRLVRGANP